MHRFPLDNTDGEEAAAGAFFTFFSGAAHYYSRNAAAHESEFPQALFRWRSRDGKLLSCTTYKSLVVRRESS